jgi:hypothetical protein
MQSDGPDNHCWSYKGTEESVVSASIFQTPENPFFANVIARKTTWSSIQADIIYITNLLAGGIGGLQP